MPIFGCPYTVNVKVIGVPAHPFSVGVTVMVATAGNESVLIAKKPAKPPVPLAPRPIDGLLFVQLYTVPAGPPPKVTPTNGKPGQTAWLATGLTPGLGLDVIVPVAVTTPQPPVNVTV